MINHQTYHKLHPNTEAFNFETASKLPFDPRPEYLFRSAADSADVFLLMAPDTRGFYFTEKKWSKHPNGHVRSSCSWMENSSSTC